MTVNDYLLALKLHKQLNGEVNSDNKKTPTKVAIKKLPSNSIIDPDWEITDPNPDIHSLFGVFNVKFFWNALGAVEVKWSPRMYTCAGICTYKGRAGCIVSLSLPLLKFRPRKDLVETLLHEMIHAYLFVTKNNKDRGSHGPEFCKHMDRINKEAGTHITIYHSFHDEVNHYKTHVWRCNGSCKANPPYFGYVRRATNRAPGPNDFWFSDHKHKCGGSFDKISEPDNFKAKPQKKIKMDQPVDKPGSNGKKKAPINDKNKNDLRNFISSSTAANTPPTKTTTIAAARTSGQTFLPQRTSILTSNGLSAPVHGIQPNKEQGGSVVKHGGVKNNIFGFGNLRNSENIKATEKKSENKDNFKVPLVPFGGMGHVLGSNSSANDKSKSCLLSNFNSSKNVNKKDINKSSSPSTSSQSSTIYYEDLTGLDFDDDFGLSTTLSSQDSSEEDEDVTHLHCPVCNVGIKRGVSINEHLDDCTQLENIFSSSRNDTLSDSDSDNDDPTFIERNSINSPQSPPVNCPNCTSVFTASTINQHLDQCLSFD